MQRAVGLDIGWGRICVVELTDNNRITRYGTVKVKRPQERDAQQIIARQIDELLRMHDVPRDAVVTNLRGSHILARTYQAPAQNRDVFEQWFVENIDSLIPGAPLDDVIYDHQFLDADRVLISFARLGVVMQKIEMLKNANITPLVIDASCLALYHIFSHHQWLQKKLSFAILDIGSQITDLLITNRGVPYASAELPCGRNTVGRGISKREDFVVDLATRTLKTIDFYRKKDSIELQGIIITGEYARTRGLRTVLRRVTDLKVVVGDPLKERKIDCPSDFPAKKSLLYTQAVGLALKGLNPEKQINLIPPEVKQQHANVKFNKRMRKIFVRHAIAVSIIGIIGLVLLFVLTGRLRDMHNTVNELKDEKSSLAYVSSEERTLRQKIAKLHALGQKQYTWSKMLYNIGKVTPEGVYFKEISTRTRLVKNGNQMDKVQYIVIDGDAHNHTKIVQFIKNLEDYYDTIIIDKIKEERGCEFTLTLKI
jgi:Tfp pilus assembly PilM family ATPase/Tfp pilus assembly protein PilN